MKKTTIIHNKFLNRWYILALVSSILIIYLIFAFIVVIIFKNNLAGMASFVLYYLPIIWIGMTIVTHQRYSIIQGSYIPKPKKIFTRKNIMWTYLIMGAILLLNLKEALSSQKFGSEFAAMVIFGWLLVWFGAGCVLFSDFVFEKFLKKVRFLEISLLTWSIFVIIILIVLVGLLYSTFHAASIENRKYGITNFLGWESKGIKEIPLSIYVEKSEIVMNDEINYKYVYT